MKAGKILLVLGMGLFLGLAAFNNSISYNGSFGAVKSALDMSGTFNDPNVMWRAINSPLLVWLALISIIAAEAIGAFFCFKGALAMWKARGETANFNAAKSSALLGLTICAAFYFVAFHVVAGEWFMLWQNREAPTLAEAFRNFASAMLIMIWVNTNDN